ncbi:hypothetical protein, partial [Brevundimonas sp.]|uniref:hypothetical protein n=1 Tax=Brevundimonas sp. TaxID=1871086 RepID=UPI003D6CDE1A
GGRWPGGRGRGRRAPSRAGAGGVGGRGRAVDAAVWLGLAFVAIDVSVVVPAFSGVAFVAFVALIFTRVAQAWRARARLQ